MNVDFTVTEQEVERLVSKTPLRKAVPDGECCALSSMETLCGKCLGRDRACVKILLGSRKAGLDPSTLEGFTVSLDCQA